jgi:hypothetical protein
LRRPGKANRSSTPSYSVSKGETRVEAKVKVEAEVKAEVEVKGKRSRQ